MLKLQINEILTIFNDIITCIILLYNALELCEINGKNVREHYNTNFMVAYRNLTCTFDLNVIFCMY